jgi:protein phosphatase
MQVAVTSEKGLREENQDWLSWVQSPRGELLIVADGMGGHKGGERAAKMTIEHVERHLAEAPADWPFARAVDHAVREANDAIYRLAQSGDPEMDRMGSTVVVALVADGKVQVGHVGDSRAYLFRNGHLTPLTRDHTSVQQMVDAGMLTLEQARSHPDAHILNRAVGSRPHVDVEVGSPVRLEKGDALLLCSDGLSGFVTDDEIARVLREQPDVQRVPGALAALALTSGGSDNVTVQFARFGPPARLRWTDKLPARVVEPPASSRTGRRLWPWALAGAVGVAAATAPFAWPDPPTIERFECTNGCQGDRVVLRWKVVNADEVRIEPDLGAVPLEGERAITVTTPRAYDALATRTLFGLWSLRAERRIDVQPAPDAPAGSPETPPGTGPPAGPSEDGAQPGGAAPAPAPPNPEAVNGAQPPAPRPTTPGSARRAADSSFPSGRPRVGPPV